MIGWKIGFEINVVVVMKIGKGMRENGGEVELSKSRWE